MNKKVKAKIPATPKFGNCENLKTLLSFCQINTKTLTKKLTMTIKIIFRRL
jgi:hypothetical protein